MVFNERQVLAIKALNDFLESDKSFFCLSGSAGTGKTTIIKEVLKNRNGVIVSAPTHKAKRVISKATGLEAITIHSALCLSPNMELEKFDKNNIIFDTKAQTAPIPFKILVIDEASMLNKDLVGFIKQLIGKKVIFIGDHKQLPPVKETESLVFLDSEIEQFRLEKIERQSEGSTIIDICNQVLSGDYDFKESENVKIFSNPMTFGEEIVSRTKFGENPDYRILCFTNKCCSQWNNYVRGMVIGDYKTKLVVGEWLVCQRTVKDVCENSTDYQLQSFSDAEYFGLSGYECWVVDEWDNTSLIFILKNESYKDFLNEERKLRREALDAKSPQQRGFLWRKYYKYTNSITVLGTINDQYGSKIYDASFDYIYAQTVHKSQGSTYKEVFIIKSDIMACQDRMSIMYVACSRPSETLNILS